MELSWCPFRYAHYMLLPRGLLSPGADQTVRVLQSVRRLVKKDNMLSAMAGVCVVMQLVSSNFEIPCTSGRHYCVASKCI
jgi:hypothetical protein